MQKSYVRSLAAVAGTTLALTAGSTVGTTAAHAGAAAAASEPTGYAMTAFGYGTRVVGGDVPANSGQTAYQVLGCNNKAGIDKSNTEAYQAIPGVGVARGAVTRVWTQQSGGVVSSYGRHTLESLTINEATGKLVIEGIQSTSRAWHDSTGFHRNSGTRVGDLTYTPTGGEPQSVEAPLPGQPVTVPGIGVIAVGEQSGFATGGNARAAATALAITRTVSGTESRIARSTATIAGGVRGGLFGGFGYGSQATGLADNTRSGPTPLQLVPCQGTRGEFVQRTVASVDLGNGIVLDGLATGQSASQDADSAQGYEAGRVNNVAINGEDLVVRDVRGRAVAELTRAGLSRSTNGTEVGEVTANGESRTFPESGVLVIPGVARLERSLVTRYPDGIGVIALRITLLDGSGAVLNLGKATMRVRPSGL